MSISSAKFVHSTAPVSARPTARHTTPNASPWLGSALAALRLTGLALLLPVAVVLSPLVAAWVAMLEETRDADAPEARKDEV